MARTPTLQQIPANLSFAQMEAALPKIDRRIAELEAFDINGVTERSDASIQALESTLENFLNSTFGPDTVEHRQYSSISMLNTASIYMGSQTPIDEVRAGLERGLSHAIAQLNVIKNHFQEQLDDAGRGESTRPLRAYEGLDLQSDIESAAGQLYRDGHYANAIEDAVKALNALVRLKSGVDDKDGATLMQHVFGPKNPILKVNALADQSDKDEQQGMMMMFWGAVSGLRNPRAHMIIRDDPEKTLEFLAFVSLLAKIASAATKS